MTTPDKAAPHTVTVAHWDFTAATPTRITTTLEAADFYQAEELKLRITRQLGIDAVIIAPA